MEKVCFGILPVLYDLLRGHSDPTTIVLCISPLISLMADQKAKFSPRGLATEFVGGAQEDVTAAYKAVLEGKCQFVYMTPESLFDNHLWWEMLRSPVYQTNLVVVVVNEAHCVQKW